MVTRVYLQNNTAHEFELEHKLVQPDDRPLPDGSYRWHDDNNIEAGERVELLRFHRSSGVRRGAEYIFESRLSLGGREISLLQKMRGGLLNSHLWHSLGGQEWFDDRDTHVGKWQTADEEIEIRYRALFTGGDDDVEYVLNHGPWPENAEENTLNILAYNIFMRPGRVIFRDGQRKRTDLLPEELYGNDVIVFSEAFDDRLRERLLESLRPQYPHSTCVLGADVALEQDGGVIIVSKWPIEDKRQRPFGADCEGWDCSADKGVLYARVNKAGRRFHIFGSHAQAGREHKDIRRRQFETTRAFIGEQNIPEDEAVIIAGDLNVNRYDDEFQAMLATLDAACPEPVGYGYTVDPHINKLSAADRNEYLDYVLYSNAHLRPVRATVETRIFRSRTAWRQFFWQAPSWELSDHFPVYGRLEYGDETRG